MSLPNDSAIDVSELWAKSPPSDSCHVEGYPLLLHLLDVAAVGSALLSAMPSPGLQAIQSGWIEALVGLHDLGKASPGFQWKLGGPRGQVGAPDRHDASTVPLLLPRLVQMGCAPADASAFANAVAAHHGGSINAVEIAAAGRWPFSPGWTAAQDALFQCVVSGTGATDTPVLPAEPNAAAVALQWLMGLTTLADWIGSSDAICRWDRLACWSGDAVAWYASSRVLAKKALMDVGLTAAGLSPVETGAEAVALALNGRDPRPLQQAVARVIDQLGDEPGLVVIEAPMGEGKTEAGFACSCGRGLYVAMPTQATSNALFPRAARFISHAVEGPTQVALAHSAGRPDMADLRLREVGLGTPDSGVTAGWWFKGGKRTLLCPHAVGTVDQALVGVLNTRHSFLRLFGLAGRTVIFDELHAYDTYTSGLIQRLVEWLQGLGCRVVIMSATLPNARRDALLLSWAGAGDAPVPSASYPRVTVANRGAITAQSFPAARHQAVTVEGIALDQVAEQAVTMSQQGARVLVVVNKVRRAQALFQQVWPHGPSTLFHARFPMDQRLKIEQSVLSHFGPEGTATAGHVLIATQVAEQSLDIDMDLLITDIAPVDLVLQRAGRIHRHERGQRNRPAGFTEPKVLVGGLDKPVPPAVLTSYVYDPWLVLRSAAWLQGHPQLQLPADIDLAVQQVYGDWIAHGPEQLLSAIRAALPEHKVEQQQMRQWAEQAALPHPSEWGIHQHRPLLSDDLAEAGAAQFGTRLGDPSITVVPVNQQHLNDLSEYAPFLAQHYIRVSDRRLTAQVRNTPLPKGWRDIPGLEHHLPLMLDDDGVGPGYRLDATLGLVIGNGGGLFP